MYNPIFPIFPIFSYIFLTFYKVNFQNRFGLEIPIVVTNIVYITPSRPQLSFSFTDIFLLIIEVNLSDVVKSIPSYLSEYKNVFICNDHNSF